MTLPPGTLTRGVAEPGARLFVWLGWAVMSVVALGYVAQFGPAIPVRDDFAVVGILTGDQAFSLEWLWSLHNEHRVPLPKLLLLGLYKISGNDFRAGMFCSVALLSLLAAISLVVAGQREGGNRSYDLAFPLCFLSLAHQDNLLWSWQVQLVLPSVIGGGLILLIASRTKWSHRSALLTGLALVALTLCGANGTALVPAFVLWLGFVAFVQRSPACLMAAVASLGALVLYFLGYQSASYHPPAPDIASAARTSLQFLSLMFGTLGRDLWPGSAVAVTVLVACSVAILMRTVLVGSADERPRALGILAAFAAQGSLVLGLGWGRGGSGEFAGFESRYVTMITPTWIAVFFCWDLYTSPAWRQIVLSTLVSVFLILLWPTTERAIDTGRAVAEPANLLIRDIRLREPIYRLARRYSPFMHPSHDELARQLGLLRKANLGVFSSLSSDPTFREIPLSVQPDRVSMGRWEKGMFHGTGVDPYLHYALPTAERVAGIRLDYAHSNPAGTVAHFQMKWNSATGIQPAPSQRVMNWALRTGPERSTVIWIDDIVKEIWIQPDNQACDFGVRGITVLVDSLLVPGRGGR